MIIKLLLNQKFGIKLPFDKTDSCKSIAIHMLGKNNINSQFSFCRMALIKFKRGINGVAKKEYHKRFLKKIIHVLPTFLLTEIIN